MPTAPKLSLFLAVCLITAGMHATGVARPCLAQAALSGQQPAKGQRQAAQTRKEEEVPDSEEQPSEGELAPAAVELDVSNASLLIQELYQATRETKEQAILARLTRAKELVQTADVKAADSRGRTALHWTVFGSSYTVDPKVQVGYEEIADALIGRGVEINREDVYNDTALDYLLYSPNFEMQTLLIEHGASSGFLAAFYHFFNELSTNMPPTHAAAVSASRKADLGPGQTLSIRLDVPVYSDRSRTGDPVDATVTYPLCKSGEIVECKKGEPLVSPGTKVNGTILFAQKAPDKYSRPRIVLDFSNIVHKDGQLSPLYARVLDTGRGQRPRDRPQQ